VGVLKSAVRIGLTMKLHRIISGLVLLTLIIIERPSGGRSKPETVPPLLNSMGLDSNCQRLLYLPEVRSEPFPNDQ
jgi:hypothetical protein